MNSLGWGLGMIGALILCVLGLAVVLLRRRYLVVTVRGTSMEPTLRSGDRVLVRRVMVAAVRVGDVVVLRNPQSEQPASASVPPQAVTDRMPGNTVDLSSMVPWIIKRVRAVPGDAVPRAEIESLREAVGSAVPVGSLVLLGDNPAASFDSRQWGYYAEEHLLGVVARRVDAPSGDPKPHISRA